MTDIPSQPPESHPDDDALLAPPGSRDPEETLLDSAQEDALFESSGSQTDALSDSDLAGFDDSQDVTASASASAELTESDLDALETGSGSSPNVLDAPSSDEMKPLGSSRYDDPILIATDSGRLDDASSARIDFAQSSDTYEVGDLEIGSDGPDYQADPMIHLKGLYKKFGSREILRGIDLEVYPGETICIIGGSGTGKSVTLKHIMRLIDPDRGEVWLDGENITHAYGDRLQKARSKLGVNFQFGALLNWLTVFENVALPLRENTRMSAKEIERRVMGKLELLSIPHARDLFPTQISGGMVKRAGLARAVVMEETIKVILYDEPTSGLDPISTAVVDEMVNEMKSRLGLSQVIVTHDMTSAYRTADRIAVLHEGKVVQYGTAEEIQTSTVPYVQQFVRGLSTQEALDERSRSGRFNSSELKAALRSSQRMRKAEDNR